MRPKHILPCTALLYLAACAGPGVEKRLAAIEETHERDIRLLSLRMEGVEKRLDRAEEDIGALRGSPAPHSARKSRVPAGDDREHTYPPPATKNSVPQIKSSDSAATVAPPLSIPDAALVPQPPAPIVVSMPASSVPAAALPPPASAATPVPPPPASAAVPAPASSAGQTGTAAGAKAPTLVPLDLPASKGRAPVKTAQPKTIPPQARASSPAAEAAGAPAGLTASGSRAAYNAALALYNKHNYAKAAAAFAAFLRDAPQSPLAPNAGYWLGECSYAAGKYGDSVIAFKDVAAKYPGHPKAAAALLKACYAYERMGDTGNAGFYRQLLLDDYPSSGPAALARKRGGSR